MTLTELANETYSEEIRIVERGLDQFLKKKKSKWYKGIRLEQAQNAAGKRISLYF